MAGLLDAFNTDAGLLGLMLMNAGRAQPVRQNVAGGLLEAMQGLQQHRAGEQDRATRRDMQGMQIDAMRQEAADRARQREQAARDTELLRGQFGQLPGPTPDGSPLMRAFDPASMLGQGASPQAVLQALGLHQAMQKPAVPLLKLGAGEVAFDPSRPGAGPVFSAPDKPAAPTELARLLAESEKLPPGSPLHAVYQQQIAKMTTHAPGTTVSVNTGQKGFDNTLKLRSDFRGEPVYKAHQEMQAAYAQIQQSLKQASPAGDLAGATKIMKLLDPGSVVRESELGMAMQASGLLDRVQNYASNVLNGTKLTPSQRADFQRLADALYSEGVKQYNAKRTEYQGISERNSLNTLDVLGPAASAPGKGGGVIDFGSLK